MPANRPGPDVEKNTIGRDELETMTSREQLLGMFVVFLLLLLAILLTYL